MLRRYEVLLLTVSEITQDEARDLENSLEKLIEKAKGSLISFDRWGKYRLAYAVNNNEYGVYFLMRFEIPQEITLLADLESMLSVKFNDIVIRTMITRLEADAPLTYQRPRSLEEGPITREPSLFSEGGRGNHEREQRGPRHHYNRMADGGQEA